jgi:hypothetical protein
LTGRRLKVPVGSVKFAPSTTAVLPAGTFGSASYAAGSGGGVPEEGVGVVREAISPQPAKAKKQRMKKGTRRIGLSLLGELLIV